MGLIISTPVLAWFEELSHPKRQVSSNRRVVKLRIRFFVMEEPWSEKMQISLTPDKLTVQISIQHGIENIKRQEQIVPD